MLQDSFNREFDNGQKASPGADLSRVGAVALARGVETVHCTTQVLPLRYFHVTGKDFYSQRVVCNFLSIGIQLCWRGILCRSHLLCSVP